MQESESSKSSNNMHEDTLTLLSTIKSLEENCASCISEQEFADIFEPTYKLLPGISRTKIYNFFHERMKKGNISKQMNIDELNLIFTKKTTLLESCHPFENAVAWRPSGEVKVDLAVSYNEEQKRHQEKIEKEIHEAKSELKNLMDQIEYKRNKIDLKKSEVPELQAVCHSILNQHQEIRAKLLNNNTSQVFEI